MGTPLPTCLLRREYEPAALLKAHPPVLRHPHKQLLFELTCPPGAVHSGRIVLTRWRAAPLPTTVALAPTKSLAVPGTYDYNGDDAGVWHVNFADPQLFVAYGSALLAQDELQAAEHPVLGALREALLAEGLPAKTEVNGEASPVLVLGAERRCSIATAPDSAAGRPLGLYGNRFAEASPKVVRAAVQVLQPPTRSNLIAIAAPAGGRGPYFRRQLEQILTTAYTGFAAAVAESQQRWPGQAVEIRTGFWGCGAFGGNRHAMTLLQLLAARLAGVDHLRFYTFDDAGQAAFRTGSKDLDAVIAAGAPGEALAELIERIADLDYEWGVSDGN
ncbi:poly(ADP-ribose) glycohydrolase [Hyalangium versicolor]|uniref:poly(ADP-ribose) glycohydrolase n=1 Tax=Hyalangium versicolor TaxID=2861190 RepID=UPI001CCF58F7|nr:poly(ADP-ribose) glycohydrolase [Hyalangium versicolor]